MKKSLIRVYDWLGIETNDWNWMQLFFGRHYFGLVIWIMWILAMIALCVC